MIATYTDARGRAVMGGQLLGNLPLLSGRGGLAVKYVRSVRMTVP